MSWLPTARVFVNNMSAETNEEIVKKFDELGVKIGPVTDSTRSVYLRKLKKLQAAQGVTTTAMVSEIYSDDRLRAALKVHNVDVGPITSESVRQVYLKRLKALEEKHGRLLQSEPMDIEQNYEEVEDDL